MPPHSVGEFYKACSNNVMKLALAEAKRILEAEKQLFDLHPWKGSTTAAAARLTDTFRARVALDGGAFRGLWFRVSTILEQP